MTSALFHTFRCCGRVNFFKFLRCDVAGIVIIITFTGIPIMYLMFWCDHGWSMVYFTLVPLLGAIVMSMIISDSFVHPDRKLQRALAMGALLAIVLFGIMHGAAIEALPRSFPGSLDYLERKKDLETKPVLERLIFPIFFDETGDDDNLDELVHERTTLGYSMTREVHDAVVQGASVKEILHSFVVPQYVKAFVSLIIGALLYVLKMPECLAPGRFDIVGQSHHLFHISVTVAILFSHTGLIRHIDAIVNHVSEC